MAALLASVETTLDTDFAILTLQQGLNDVDPIGTFALSAAGAVRVSCGTKYARVHVRAERWDARPPFDPWWEDSDELPFTEVPGEGPLIIAGFDLGTVGLDVDGLGAARVQALARGRHRYAYGDGPSGDELPPEEWLFRFFPAEGDVGPFSGAPRRLVGEGGLYSGLTDPWYWAHRAVDVSGWHEVLRSSSFTLLHRALWGEHGPATAGDLARRLRGWGLVSTPAGADPLEDVIGRSVSEPDPLAELTGRPSPLTVSQAVDALCDLGLLLVEQRDGRELLIPNPAPETAWSHRERNGADEVTVRRIRVAALQRVYGVLATDIRNAMSWAGAGGVRTTVRAIAVRLGATVDEVAGALRLLVVEGFLSSDADLGLDAVIEPDAPLRLSRRKV